MHKIAHYSTQQESAVQTVLDARVEVQKPLQRRRLPRPAVRAPRSRVEVGRRAVLPRRRHESADERAVCKQGTEAHELREEQAEDDPGVRSKVHRPRVSLT